MVLRVLTLVAFLGLHSGAGALMGWLHLCQGKVQPRSSCCCGPGYKAPEPGSPQWGLAKGVRCCAAPGVQPASSTALALSEGRWELPPLRALPPAPPARVPPPEPESLPAPWVRTEGVRRSTAPPLYLQNCSYLI